jgi:hypothetical protein
MLQDIAEADSQIDAIVKEKEAEEIESTFGKMMNLIRGLIFSGGPRMLPKDAEKIPILVTDTDIIENAKLDEPKV